MAGNTKYRTPRPVFAEWNHKFDFNVDAAASDENALVRPDGPPLPSVDWEAHMMGVPAWGRFYTAETDGTNRDHYEAGDRVWCNPPYSPDPLVTKFVETAAMTAREQGVLWVMLLNASSTGTRWFHKYVWDDELDRPRERVVVKFPPGRIAFLDENGKVPLDKSGKPQSPRYNNMFLTFYPWGAK